LLTALTQVKKKLAGVADDVAQSQRKLEVVVSELSTVQSQLSTRRIGVFPQYVDRLVALIRNAKKSLVFAVDFPGYCSFSDHDVWLQYKTSIEAAIGRLPKTHNESPVKMAWLNPDLRRSVLKEQFDPKDINDAKDEWKNRGNNMALLTHYLDVHRGSIPTLPTVTPDTITYKQFASFVEHDQAIIIQCFLAAECKSVTDGLNLYFWIVDESEAVFAIPNYNARNQSVAFYTRDKALVDGLLQIYPRLKGDASAKVERLPVF